MSVFERIGELFRRKQPSIPANSQVLFTSDVFLAGPTPTITFVDRSSSPEFTEVSRALQQRGKIISLTGPSKSGKTVISVNQVLKGRSPVQVHGTKIKSVAAFWNALRGELGLPIIRTHETLKGKSIARSGGASVTLGSAGQGELSIGGSISVTDESADAAASVYDADSIAEVEAELRRLRSPIVIDDFHWVDDGALQVDLIKSLRPLLQSGTSVILTSVTELNSRALRGIPDLALLHSDVKVPTWTFDQLVQIAGLGFHALNADIDERVFRILAKYSYRNPMLMQEYCSRLAYQLDIEQTAPVRQRREVADEQIERVLKATAEDKAKLFAKYCDNRGDTTWTLTSGNIVNMNQLIFLALSRVWVMTPIGMDALTRRMRRLIASEADRVRINSGLVTSHARRISADMLTDMETRTPLALDQSTAQLNILDPFFKAYLNWQLSPRLLNEQPPLTPVEQDDSLDR